MENKIDIKDYLEIICDKCYKNAGKNKISCPFRSIDNERCLEYENIIKELNKIKE